MTLVELVEQWLEDKHITLWAEFDVQRPDSRHKAAKWFVQEMTDFITYQGTRR